MLGEEGGAMAAIATASTLLSLLAGVFLGLHYRVGLVLLFSAALVIIGIAAALIGGSWAGPTWIALGCAVLLQAGYFGAVVARSHAHSALPGEDKAVAKNEVRGSGLMDRGL